MPSPHAFWNNPPKRRMSLNEVVTFTTGGGLMLTNCRLESCTVEKVSGTENGFLRPMCPRSVPNDFLPATHAVPAEARRLGPEVAQTTRRRNNITHTS